MFDSPTGLVWGNQRIFLSSLRFMKSLLFWCLRMFHSSREWKSSKKCFPGQASFFNWSMQTWLSPEKHERLRLGLGTWRFLWTNQYSLILLCYTKPPCLTCYGTYCFCSSQRYLTQQRQYKSNMGNPWQDLLFSYNSFTLKHQTYERSTWGEPKFIGFQSCFRVFPTKILSR